MVLVVAGLVPLVLVLALLCACACVDVCVRVLGLVLASVLLVLPAQLSADRMLCCACYPATPAGARQSSNTQRRHGELTDRPTDGTAD